MRVWRVDRIEQIAKFILFNVCHTREHPEKGLPRPTLATAFEVVIDGKRSTGLRERRFSGGS
jgi:hypothetical protein